MADELSAEVLGGLTVSHLYELARECAIKNPRKYKKNELIDLILEVRIDAIPAAGPYIIRIVDEALEPIPAVLVETQFETPDVAVGIAGVL